MAVAARRALPTWRDGSGIRWLTAVDHKRVGLLYAGSAIVLFVLLGLVSLLLALDVGRAPAGLLDLFAQRQLGLLQGTAALFGVGLPLALGLACHLVPLQVGSRRIALPHLNALGFWLWLGGVLLALAAPGIGDAELVTDEGPNLAAPLAGEGRQMWVLGLVILFLGAACTSISVLATVVRRRTSGMTVSRLPLLTWGSSLFGVVTILSAGVTLAIGIVFLIDEGSADVFALDAGAGFYASGVWFLTHPLAFALLLPAMAALLEAVPVLIARPLRAPMLGVAGLMGIAAIAALVAIAHLIADALGASFVTQLAYAGLVVVGPVAVCLLALVPSLAARRGRTAPPSGVVLAIGAVAVLVVGTVLALALGVSSIDEPASYHLTGLYAGTLGGVVLLGLTAGLHFWLPKLTGRLLDERGALAQAGLTVVGLGAMLVGAHVVGESNLARLVASSDLEGLSSGAKVGAAFVLAGFLLVFFGGAGLVGELARALLWGRRAGNDPWQADTLEWLATSPPADDNFTREPTATSARPLADLRARRGRTDAASRRG